MIINCAWVSYKNGTTVYSVKSGGIQEKGFLTNGKTCTGEALPLFG